MHTDRSLVFLADFFNQPAGHKILQFLIGAKTEHFLSTADGIPQLEICKNPLEQIVESEDFFLGKNVYKFIGNVVW